MNPLIALTFGLALAGCTQTVASSGTAQAPEAATPTPAVTAGAKTSPKTAAQARTAAERCAQAAKGVADKQMQAAMLGGALSMAGGLGGLGGFAGQGGAIAAQAASVGGSLIQQQAGNEARAAMDEECR